MRLLVPLVSGMDRVSRAFLGCMMIILAFMLPTTAEWFARLVIGAIYPLITALIAWDPIYSLFYLIREKLVEFFFFR